MALATYDISADQGSDFSTVITYSDDAGNPVNLTGATGRMQVRRFAGSPAANITLTNGSGVALGGVLGTITITISSAALSQVPAGAYVYDIEIVDTSQKVLKVISGNFIVGAEVTR
jgi:hypothetical protein